MIKILMCLLITAPGVAIAMTDCKVMLVTPEDFAQYARAIRSKVAACWGTRREEIGMSQVEAAQALGITQSTFSKRLKVDGVYKWTDRDLRTLADLLGVSVAQLLPDDVELADDPTIVKLEWIKLVQKFYERQGRAVTAAEASGVASEALRLAKLPRARDLSAEDVIRSAILECALNVQPTW